MDFLAESCTMVLSHSKMIGVLFMLSVKYLEERAAYFTKDRKSVPIMGQCQNIRIQAIQDSGNYI